MQRNGTAPQATDAALPGNDMPLQNMTLTMQPSETPVQAAGMTLQNQEAPLQASPAVVQTPVTPMQLPVQPARRRVVDYNSNAGIDKRLVDAQIAIATALANPSLAARLDGYGYGVAQLQHGQALHARAQALYQQQRAGYGERFTATDALAFAQSQAHATYIRHIAIARVALRADRGAVQKLDLAVARRRTQAGWLLQAQQFYTNTLADSAIAQKLAAYGVTREQLAETQGQVAAVASRMVAQHAANDAAQALTKARDTALAALDRWMRDFRAIACVALADLPHEQG